jgi:hypothetical protein
MNKRLLALMFIGLVSLAGLALAQDPPTKDEPPVRLKKRKPRGEDKPMVDPNKTEEKKKDDKKGEKKEDHKAEPREAEPVTPQEEEKEVLHRVVTNVHRVGERLAKNDLGEATQQTQLDILKDLESLIRRNENSPPQGGGQQDQNNGGGSGDNQDNQDQQGGGGQQNQKQQSRGGKSQGQSKGGQKSRSGGGSGTKSGGQQQRGGKAGENKLAGKDEKAGEKPGGRNGKNGNGGGGGDKDDRARNKNADLNKHGVWGHLPQTLRAQMDAYSNPQPFMPKYDDLIKRYYRTIAEQGRRKGE